MKLQTLSTCTNIIWDWNGTLLNDLDICVNSINRLLGKRSLSPLDTQKYLEIFTFPVQKYYVSAGFDFDQEPFETVAVEFMDIYLHDVCEARLHSGVTDTLRYFRETGRTQTILSAMENSELKKLVKQHGIEEYFADIYGIENHLAHGKAALAAEMIIKTGFNRDETCLIGDTLHDSEVARELGIKCLLIANGHQSEIRLQSSGYPVIRSLGEIETIFS